MQLLQHCVMSSPGWFSPWGQENILCCCRNILRLDISPDMWATKSFNLGCRGWGVVGWVGRYSLFNEAVIIREWSTSIPKSTENQFCVVQYDTTTLAWALFCCIFWRTFRIMLKIHWSLAIWIQHVWLHSSIHICYLREGRYMQTCLSSWLYWMLWRFIIS